MKENLSKLFLLTILIFIGGTFIVAGQVYQNPQLIIDQKRERMERAEEQRRQEDTLRIRIIDTQINRNRPVSRTKSKESNKVAINNEDVNLFHDFLNKAGTGILRLHDLNGCERNKKQCPQSLAGKGSSYSFRQNIYVEKSFADILFENLSFQLQGINTLGFLTDLGDLPLENLSLTSNGIKELKEFEPSNKLEVIDKQYLAANKGFKVGNFIYTTSLLYKENSTFAFRSILYNVISKSEDNGKGENDVNSKPTDGDVIIVFRVIRKHEDKSISLLWKTLQTKESPTIVLE